MSGPAVLITRAEADAAPFAEALRAAGWTPVLEPMLTIRPLDGAPLDLAGAAALAFTSANGVRVFAARTADRSLPAFAVGPATADAARAAGFARIHTAGGDVEALAAEIADALEPGDLVVHAAGASVAGDLAGALAAAGLRARRAALYEAIAAEALSPDVAAQFARGAIAWTTFFSPRTAKTFVRLLVRAGLADAARRAGAACLSQQVAEAARAAPWRRIAVAARPDYGALVEALARAS